MRPNKTVLSLVATLGLSLGAASIALGGDDNKCTIATKGDSPTAKACAEGGKKAAAKQMKVLVKTAKAKDVKFVCDDCHKNNDDYALTDNARKDFEKLLAAQK
jgi:hypothetical protein